MNKKYAELPASRLRATFDSRKIPCENSNGLSRKTNGARLSPQPRALKALELGLHISHQGFNIYLSGESNLGRSYMLKEFLKPHAKKATPPPDLLYVYNFEDPDQPTLLQLPAGQGKKLKNALSQALGRIRKELPTHFETEAYVQKRARVLEKFQQARQRLLKEMDAVAENQGFNLDMDEQGSLTLYPLIEGKRLSEEEFEKLDTTLRADLKQKGDQLLNVMTGLMRKLTQIEQGFAEDEQNLEREIISTVLDEILTPVVDSFYKTCANEKLTAYFKAMREDMLENPENLISRDILPPGNQPAPQPAPRNGRPAQGTNRPASGPEQQSQPNTDENSYYDINLFVDNSATKGAPIITDDHPTPANLLGCLEREAEMGALVTDFTLIKAGSLHRANGGYLLLRMEDILQYPNAWEGLMRALRSGLARIEDSTDQDSSTKTKGITPEPMPVDLKVILIGNEDMYEALLTSDDRFSKLFRIKAHLAETMPRDAGNIRVFLSHLARIIDESGLLPFDKEALAGLVDHGSRLCQDQKKLTLKFPLMRELMIEASALATLAGEPHVNKQVLTQALRERTYRANLFEEQYMEEYNRRMIKVSTSGSAVGCVNGLSVTWYGDYEFGLPHRIACTVGVGHDGIIDLEREAELGGPIHTKAMMILKSYLLEQFARNKPLMLTGSLCFEQCYAGIEGDSASGAELAALLSALADVPIRLSLAFTGAVSQSGQIMAVGGVTRKIEGFYEVCVRHGLSGEQGVLLPRDNIDHLMLSPELVNAVETGMFHICPVTHITEAMEILTGLPAGKRRADNTFTPGSLYDKVDKRLAEMGRTARRFGKM